MTINMIAASKQKNIIVEEQNHMICSTCKNSKIEWKEIYYEENSKLIKSEKLHLGWCSNCKTYILN